MSFVTDLQVELDEANHRIELLVDLIHRIGMSSGVLNEIPISGPQALMFGEDIAMCIEPISKDAERYYKLRRLMGSNVKEGWDRVVELGAVASYLSWDDFDRQLDDLTNAQVNVGLNG